jgi:hypothetical protein
MPKTPYFSFRLHGRMKQTHFADLWEWEGIAASELSLPKTLLHTFPGSAYSVQGMKSMLAEKIFSKFRTAK